jgi:hypothetical protein
MPSRRFPLPPLYSTGGVLIQILKRNVKRKMAQNYSFYE